MKHCIESFSMVKKLIESGYAEVLKILGLFLTGGSMIVAITLFIADRPSRAEVREIIEKNVGDRIGQIEIQVTETNRKIDNIYRLMIEK